MSKNNFTNENEFDFKFDLWDDSPLINHIGPAPLPANFPW